MGCLRAAPALSLSSTAVPAIITVKGNAFLVCLLSVSLTLKSITIAVVGGNDHLIERNVFHDLLLESFDSGAICAFAPALLMSMCSLRP